MTRNGILGLLLLVSMLARSHSFCPAPELIWPCACEEHNFDCGSSTEFELKRAFDALRSHPDKPRLLSVTFRNLTIPVFPAGLLANLNLGHLEIRATRLKTLNDIANNSSVFDQDSSLISLTLHCIGNCDDFDWQSLSPFKKLHTLFIRGTYGNIKTPLPSLPGVSNFWIERTDISYIVDKAFAGLTGVQDLRMRDNKMGMYSRNMFPNPASNVTLFITKGDIIKTLPDDYFEAMPSLGYVDIPSFLHNIPPLMAERTVNLQGSRGLTCDSRLKWLLRMRDEKQVNILHAICARPKNLFWRDVKSLSYDEL